MINIFFLIIDKDITLREQSGSIISSWVKKVIEYVMARLSIRSLGASRGANKVPLSRSVFKRRLEETIARIIMMSFRDDKFLKFIKNIMLYLSFFYFLGGGGIFEFFVAFGGNQGKYRPVLIQGWNFQVHASHTHIHVPKEKYWIPCTQTFCFFNSKKS